jgi:hypothetical protein
MRHSANHADTSLSQPLPLRQQKSSIIHGLYAFLQKLKRREEDSVYCAGSTHRDAEAAVHVSLKELNLDGLSLLAFRVHQGVTLVNALGRVNRVYDLSVKSHGQLSRALLTYQGPGDYAAQPSRNQNSEWIGMSPITTKSCEQLLTAFIGHEICASPKRITNCVFNLALHVATM